VDAGGGFILVPSRQAGRPDTIQKKHSWRELGVLLCKSGGAVRECFGSVVSVSRGFARSLRSLSAVSEKRAREEGGEIKNCVPRMYIDRDTQD
jgi:hypothetical protein